MFCKEYLVHSEELFSEEREYGLLPLQKEAFRPADRFKNTAGWLPWKEDEPCPCDYEQTKYGAQLEAKGVPLRFRALVPEAGVYKVSIQIDGGEQGLNAIHIYQGRRNLVQRDVVIAENEVYSYCFYTHVMDYIPIMGKPAREDLSIYISVLGEVARLTRVLIEKADAPTIFIGGDSIVADYEGFYPYNPLINGGAWGQYLLQYLKGIAVDNQAHGGMTTNCFRQDGHYDIIRKRIRPGDVFLFQFGHNDQKRRNLAAFGGYIHNLRRYIQEIRAMGAYPILVTSMSRIPSVDEQGYYDLLEDHAQACRKVGKEWQVPVIDLHEHSFRLFCSWSQEQLAGHFNDAAHANDYGAIRMAEFVAKEIERLQIEPLYSHINQRYPSPWEPDENLRPKQEVNPTDKPEKPILSIDLPELPYADCKNIRHLPLLKEAMAKGLLDPCLKFFHPFDEMPRGQFLFLFFKAYKVKNRRGYQGRYCDIDRYEYDAGNVQAAIDEELIDETTTLEDRFRPDDALTGG
ncbi:MAG: hypothetical protein JW708_02795, partial [Vallitaleaceae bacterium]|nr:hypothetical protein [Vallitaleaceae bacterium]